MEAMHNRCLIDVERFESQGGRYKRSSHIRGLEGMTTKGREYLEATILACIDAVMDEQEVQWDRDDDDYERLAKVSQDVSAHSKNVAIERDITDEKEARKIYRQDKQNLSPPTMPVRKESSDFDLCFEDETASTLDATNFTKECSRRDSTHVDLDICCKTRVFYPITISNTLAKAA